MYLYYKLVIIVNNSKRDIFSSPVLTTFVSTKSFLFQIGEFITRIKDYAQKQSK